MPEISVIIPVFNGEDFIADAIQSVQAQTLRPCEIIVIDDGSTDRTSHVVEQLGGPVRITLLRQENRGIGAARNAGVALARGEWVAFLDADDIWYPNKLEVQVGYIEAYPGFGMFYSDMDSIDPDGNIKERSFVANEQSRRSRKKANIFTIIYRGQPAVYPSSVLLRKDTFVEVGGCDRSFRRLGDTDLFERVLHIAPAMFIPQSLAKYRRRAVDPPELAAAWEEGYFQLLDRLWARWRSDPEKEVFLLRQYMRRHEKRGVAHMESQIYRQARISFWQGLSYYPWSWSVLRRLGLTFLPGIRRYYSLRKRRER